MGQAIPLMHAQVRGACVRVIVFASAYVCFRPIADIRLSGSNGAMSTDTLTPAEADALGQTLGCYFHQDWPDEFETEAQATARMRDEVPADVRALAVAGIDRLLQSHDHEEALSAALRDQVGCYLDPNYRGLTGRAWLSEMRVKLAAH